MSAAASAGDSAAGRRCGSPGRLSASRCSRPPAVVFLAMLPPTRVAMLARRPAAPRARHLAEAAEVPGGAGDLLPSPWRSMPAGCPRARRRGAGTGVYVASVVAAMGAEIAWISGAAALGTTSHFNTTPIGMALYAAAGVLAVWFTASTLVYGVLIARNRRPGFDPALRTGLALGLVLTFVLSVAFAGYMSNAGSHFVGAADVRRRRARADGLVAGGGRPPGGALLRHARDARGAARRLRRRAVAGAAAGGAGDLGLGGALGGVLGGGVRAGAGRAAVPRRGKGLRDHYGTAKPESEYLLPRRWRSQSRRPSMLTETPTPSPWAVIGAPACTADVFGAERRELSRHVLLLGKNTPAGGLRHRALADHGDARRPFARGCAERGQPKSSDEVLAGRHGGAGRQAAAAVGFRLGVAGEVGEAGELALEGELDGADRAVALLADDRPRPCRAARSSRPSTSSCPRCRGRPASRAPCSTPRGTRTSRRRRPARSSPTRAGRRAAGACPRGSRPGGRAGRARRRGC